VKEVRFSDDVSDLTAVLQNRWQFPPGTAGFHVEESTKPCHNARLDFSGITGRHFPSSYRIVSMDRQRIERQLKLAQENLSVWERQLDADKVEATARKKNAKWRSLDADVRSLKRRLIAVGGIEEREAAAEQRKAEKAAAE
jgi:hypothetical protein